MREFVFDNPKTIGNSPFDPSPVTVDRLELVSVSFNVEPEKVDRGVASVSFVLIHRQSGYKTNLLSNDVDSLALWRQIENVVEEAVLNSLTPKLPPGQIRQKLAEVKASTPETGGRP